MSNFALFVNRQSDRIDQALIRGADQTRPLDFPELIIGGSRTFDLSLVDGVNGLDAISGDASVQPTIAIGSRCSVPTGGTFAFTRGANTATGIAYNVTPAALQAALEALLSIGAGNVSVTGVANDFYRIEFIGTLADTAIDDATADGAGLTPTGSAILNRVTVGGTGENEVQILRLKQIPSVLQTSWTPGATSWTGVLSTGTYEALVALAATSPFEALVEISFTFADGTTEKMVQQAARIYCDVSDPSQFVPASFPTYLTAAQINAKFSTGNVAWVSKTGNDSSGALGRFDLHFLTVTAAQAAVSSGDTIIALPGDYSAETALAGVDGVTYQGLDGAILPAFSVATPITIYGSGLCQSIICNNASALIDMPDMDTVGSIECAAGTQTVGDVGTYIFCLGGTQTAGSAGTFIECAGGVQTAQSAGTYIKCLGGTQTAGSAGTFIECSGGVQTAQNAGSYIFCTGGVQTAQNAGSYIFCDGGTQTAGSAGSYIKCSLVGSQIIKNANTSHAGIVQAPILLSGSGSLKIYNSRVESTESNGVVVDLANSWAGSLLIADCGITATTVATNGATIGIRYGTGVTGGVQVKNLTTITAQDGTGVAKSIDAPSAQTVYIQGALSQTHAQDSDITFGGGSTITDTNLTA